MSITFGPFAFATTHLIFIVAAILAFAVAWLVSRRSNQRVADSVFNVLAVGLIVARASFVVRYFELYAEAPWQILNVRDGGFDLWAGVIGGVLMAVWEVIRRRSILQPLAIACVSGVLAWGAMTTWHDFKYGDELWVPEVRLATLDDRQVWLNREYRGKPLVVNLWATWCPPCVREMPLLEDAQQKWPDVAFVTVNQGDDLDLVLEFIQQQGLNLDDMLMDYNSILSNEINSFALPTTLFFNADGMLIDSHVGEFSAARLQQAVDQIR